MRKTTILIAATVLTLAASCTPATAEPAHVRALVAAEAGPSCGTIRMDYVPGDDVVMEVYRAVTRTSTDGEDVTSWVRQPRDPASRTDTDVPERGFVVYRLLLGDGSSVYSLPVSPVDCATPTATPTATPSPVPSASPSVSVTPNPTPTGTQTKNGLAKTGA